MEESVELLRSLSTWSEDLPLANRLTVLTTLVDYWHGERLIKPQPVKANLPIPLALSWLYSEITARNPSAFKSLCSGWVHGDPIMLFNFPREPDSFEVDESGIITFLLEQQGVFRCGTLSEASDGPVFRQEMNATTWRCCADRLSDFLLWEIVFELQVCRRETLWGLFPPELAGTIIKPMLEMNTGNVSTYGTHHQVYHANNIAIILTSNSKAEVCLEAVARTRESLETLKKTGGKRWQ
jgi:hypothetical protein